MLCQPDTKLLCKLSPRVKPEGGRWGYAANRSTGNLMVQNEANHVVVLHFLLLMEREHQTVLTDAVNHAGNPKGLLRNNVHGLSDDR